MTTLNAIRVNKRLMKPEEYLALAAHERNKIKSVRIVPAHLGHEGFGKIEVTFHDWVHEVPISCLRKSRARAKMKARL